MAGKTANYAEESLLDLFRWLNYSALGA